MQFKDIMQLLADNYTIGIGVSIGVVLVSYIIVSVLIVRFCRSENVNIGILGMIPIIQLFMWVRGKLARRRRYKNEAILDANEEITLSF